MVNGSVFLFFRCDSHYIHLAGSGRRYTAKPHLDAWTQEVLFFPEDRCVPCRSASLCAREQRTSWPREEATLSHVPAPLHPSVSHIMPTIACRACLSPVQAILHFAASQYSSRCVHHLVEPGPSQSHLIEKVRDLAEPGPSLVRAT